MDIQALRVFQLLYIHQQHHPVEVNNTINAWFRYVPLVVNTSWSFSPSNMNPTKNQGWTKVAGRVSSSCSASGTRHVNLVTNLDISHEWGKDQEVFTTSVVLCVCFVDRCLSFCTFSFGHCVVCSSSIYIFWLPLWYLQTLLRWMLYSKIGICCFSSKHASLRSENKDWLARNQKNVWA
jgi:hypothetical protein